MHQYKPYLLSLFFIVSSATFAMPAFADTFQEIDLENANHSRNAYWDWEWYWDKNLSISLENVSNYQNNQSDVSTQIVAKKSEQTTRVRQQRLPIFSRIFPAALRQ
jgi:hypothetical protein